MQLNKLVIKGLYGHIDKTILFHQNLTLLVGINGSGKTSILNIINWVLMPSIPNLCVTEFKSIQLYLRFKNTDYELVCKHNKSNFTFSIKTEEEDFSPLVVSILKRPSEIGSDDSVKSDLIQRYAVLKPDEKEKKTWDLITGFPSPNVIGLDRHLYAEEADRVYVDDGIRGRIVKKGNVQSVSPLERVKEIVNQEYRKRKNSILNLTSDLKNNLMLSTFDGSITIKSFSSGIRHKLNIAQIEGAEKRVNDYFKNFEKKILSSIEQGTISNYFAQLKEITVQYQKDPNNATTKLLYGLNASQFIKVNRLLKEFESFEEASNKELEKINRYIDTLNHFFKDSAKRLVFKEDTSELCFHTLDRKGDVVAKFKDIRFLSSGEQQILILFSYIAFNSQDGKVFIIDEPELSLHIKWQEEFIDQLESITPNGIQLILATHSPILVSRKRDSAVVLMPFN